jgi:hypothetical protein
LRARERAGRREGARMQIVDLVLAVCLSASPAECREEHLYFESHGSLRACMAEAVPAMAVWAGDHPGWKIVRFHCQWANQDGEDI